MAVVTEQDGEERGCERLESPPAFFYASSGKTFFLVHHRNEYSTLPPCHATLWVLSMRVVNVL